MIHFLRGARGKRIAWIHADYSAVKHIPEISEISNKSGMLSRLLLASRKRLHAKCDKIVCVAESAKRGFIARFPGNNERVTVCYNPQDEIDIIRRAKEAVNIGFGHHITFCTIGRFSDEKAYHRIINIAARLISEGYSFKIIMVGDGITFSKIRDNVRQYGLTETVTLVGYSENPYKYLAKCDCLLSSSLYEAFSTTVTEAMILGVPVITTACSGMEEILQDTRAGIITNNDEYDLYLSVKQILDQPASLLEMKKDAQKIGQEFTTSKAISTIEALIDRVINDRLDF